MLLLTHCMVYPPPPGLEVNSRNMFLSSFLILHHKVLSKSKYDGIAGVSFGIYVVKLFFSFFYGAFFKKL